MGNHRLLIQTALLCFSSVAVVHVLFFADLSHAQSSLGLGRSEQSIPPDGLFAGFFLWIQQNQQAFYKAMTATLTQMKSESEGLWYLVGLSFAYGVFHAAGPGHGKAVISSYMLANETAAKRGILLSFAAAFLQGITAILVIGILMLFLRGTGWRSDNLAGYLEITSYLIVMLLGLYLLWAKITGRGHHHHHDGHDDHDHDHLHAADPSQLENELRLKGAWSAIAAVGLRPCTGAIIVLTFAFLNGLYLGGVLSTFAMSVGTGITVASLALLAVGAKSTALRLAGIQGKLDTVHRVIEITGALFVFVIGLLLFSAALAA